MKKRNSPEKYKKQHEDFIRERNKWCFLKDKQKIKYHSFILLEIIPREKFNQLIDGLNKLYSDASSSCKSRRLNYEKILSDSYTNLFRWHVSYLPPIIHSKLKGKILPSDCVFHELGENIDYIHISIYKVLPSFAVLQIYVILNDKISERINDIIYKYHKEIKKLVETPEGNYTKIYGPEIQKATEIYQFRKNLHKEAVNLLSNYFKGYFFELLENDVSIVPSIDLFSLEYPEKDDEILKWGNENKGFFQCFDTFISSFTSFKFKNYLFCLERENKKFNNYIIFANRKIVGDTYSTIDNAIKEEIGHCPFGLIAIQRWIKIQENITMRLNSIVSEGILKIREKKFSKALREREKIQKNIFLFKRFKAEYEGCGFIIDKYSFKSLKSDNKERINLFEGLRKNIDASIKVIDDLIDEFTRQYEIVLNLKNLEFSKKMQYLILVLTFLIIILTLIQIIILLMG